MKRKRISGFSLVELLVVVAIIGVVATLSVGAFSRFTQRVRLTEAQVLLFAMRKSLDERRFQNLPPVILSSKICGNNQLIKLGLNILPASNETYFEYCISAETLDFSNLTIPGSANNLRLVARYPSGIASNSEGSLSANLQENGSLFYKYRDSGEAERVK